MITIFLMILAKRILKLIYLLKLKRLMKKKKASLTKLKPRI